MTEILAAVIALLTGTGIGGGSVMLRQRHNGNGNNQLLIDIKDTLHDIHAELTNLRIEVAKLEGRIG